MRIILFLLLMTVAFSGKAQYTFVFLNSRTDKTELPKAELDSLMKGHLDNITRLAKEGKLIAAGPFEGGGGIFIFNTTSVEETNEWLSTDPGIRANRWRVEVLPYHPRVGSVCAVSEPYEMVTYSFVRFIPMITKTTAGDYPQIILKHDDHINNVVTNHKIITEATFGNDGSGILIMKGDIATEILESDPGVKEGLLRFETKKLWIAKGSFCEE